MKNSFDSNLSYTQKFRLMDDIFFRAHMSDNKEALELILRILLKRPNLKIIKFETQKDMKNLHGRSSIFDIYAEDEDGTLINVEIEKTDSKASPLFLRWHSSLLDSYSLKPGQDINKMPNTVVIYITENDIFKKGQPLYEIVQFVKIEEELVPYDDGSSIIIVNGSYRGDDDIGRLMHDFRATDPDDMNFKVLAKKSRYLKKTEKGQNEMSKLVDEIKQEGIDIGIFEMVKKLFSNGYSYDQVKDLKPKLSEEMIIRAQQEALQSS